MEKKISNAENVKNLQKRKILRYLIIFFSLLTIATSLLSLIYGLNFLIPIIPFVITTILMKIRDGVVINKKDDLKEIRKVLNDSKK